MSNQLEDERIQKEHAALIKMYSEAMQEQTAELDALRSRVAVLEEALRTCDGTQGASSWWREKMAAALSSTSGQEWRAEIERPWRKLLWLRHGCTGLYGDDGEMQCGSCLLDFKRATAQEIEDRFVASALVALASAKSGDL